MTSIYDVLSMYEISQIVKKMDRETYINFTIASPPQFRFSSKFPPNFQIEHHQKICVKNTNKYLDSYHDTGKKIHVVKLLNFLLKPINRLFLTSVMLIVFYPKLHEFLNSCIFHKNNNLYLPYGRKIYKKSKKLLQIYDTDDFCFMYL
jgi:hypothetical protein